MTSLRVTETCSHTLQRKECVRLSASFSWKATSQRNPTISDATHAYCTEGLHFSTFYFIKKLSGLAIHVLACTILQRQL